jgi:hypothetical protein
MKWPALHTVKRAKTTSIIKFFQGRGGNAVSNTEKRVKAINEAIPLTQDPSVILPHKLLVVALCKQILTLIDNIRIYDKHICQLFNSMQMLCYLTHCLALGCV